MRKGGTHFLSHCTKIHKFTIKIHLLTFTWWRFLVDSSFISPVTANKSLCSNIVTQSFLFHHIGWKNVWKIKLFEIKSSRTINYNQNHTWMGNKKNIKVIIKNIKAIIKNITITWIKNMHQLLTLNLPWLVNILIFF